MEGIVNSATQPLRHKVANVRLYALPKKRPGWPPGQMRHDLKSNPKGSDLHHREMTERMLRSLVRPVRGKSLVATGILSRFGHWKRSRLPGFQNAITDGELHSLRVTGDPPLAAAKCALESRP